MGNQPWYATKEGRAEFGRRCAERDSMSEYQLCNLRANAEAEKKRAAAEQAGDWWKRAEMWIDADLDHNPTHNAAMLMLLKQCPEWYEKLTTYSASLVMQWAGINEFKDEVIEIRTIISETIDYHARVQAAKEAAKLKEEANRREKEAAKKPIRTRSSSSPVGVRAII